MTNEEEVSRYLSLLEYYKEQLQSIEVQSSYLQAAVAEYQKAKMTIEQLTKTKEGTDMLVPIGGSTFLNASIKTPSKVLFDIGAGIVAEKTVDDAVKKIDERIADLEETQNRLVSMAERVQAEAQQISDKMQTLAAETKQ